MKTKAAVIRDVGKDWEVTELDLDSPKEGEVLVRFAAAGLCPTDEHMRTGDLPVQCPVVAGHEGAGIVEETGSGVTRVKPGDHVVCSFRPVCGRCRFCARGLSHLCDLGELLPRTALLDGTFRFHGDGDLGQAFRLGTFSQWAVMSELSCITVDPVASKREAAARLGATHTAADAQAAQEIITEITRGLGADQALVTTGVVTEEIISAAFTAIRKGGTLVVTGISAPGRNTIQLPGFDLTTREKRIVGSVFGSGNPFDVIPQMLELYRSGQLK